MAVPEESAAEGARPDPAEDLLAATPETAYFWGRVAGDGELTADAVTVHAGDETATAALASIAGADRTDHRVEEHRSAHDATVVRHEDRHTVQVVGAPAERASAAFGLPIGDADGGYRFGAFDDHRAPLIRGLLESCGTICFRESSASVGVSFVHDDEHLLRTLQGLLDAVPPAVPTDDLQPASSGGHWFGLADGADVPAFARWVYADSDASGCYSTDRRKKLRRSVERATGAAVGALSGGS